jgi:hypothetical protein
MRARLRSALGVLPFVSAVAACAQPEPPPIPPSPPALAPPPGGDTGAPLTSAAARVESAPPAPEPFATLQKSILAGHDAADVVESLTTQVGARLAGSPADKLAVAWATKTMTRLGLSNVHTEPAKVWTWQRGAESAAIVSPLSQRLAVTALGWSGATPPKGIEADVLRFESLDALKAAPPRTAAGKIVFLDVRMRPAGDMSAYGAAVGARSSGPAEAAKKGALAIVIRSIGSDSSRFPHTGAMHREKDAKSAIPAGALSNADADLLERVLATGGGAVRLALHLEPRWLPDADSANVVGEVPGREKPAEVVLLGAHLDSWDLGQGAIDDGAGCGIVLEAGHALSSLPTKPRRTVRVVLFAAEENSLAGGKEYARAHAADAASIVAALEADSGTGRVVTFQYRGDPARRDRFTSIAPLLAPLGVRAIDEKAFGGADISPLRELGVPLLDLEQDPARYFDTHHTANDVFERIDPSALSQAAASFATVAAAVADMDGDFGRIPEAEREREKR